MSPQVTRRPCCDIVPKFWCKRVWLSTFHSSLLNSLITNYLLFILRAEWLKLSMIMLKIIQAALHAIPGVIFERDTQIHMQLH